MHIIFSYGNRRTGQQKALNMLPGMQVRILALINTHVGRKQVNLQIDRPTMTSRLTYRRTERLNGRDRGEQTGR